MKATRGSRILAGYAKVSKADGSQTTDLQRDLLIAAGVAPERIYSDSGKKHDHPGLGECLRSLRHLVNTATSRTPAE